MGADAFTTKVSDDGDISLPKEVRDHQNWRAGTQLSIEQTEDGVLLKRARVFPPTKSEDVFGMLKSDRPPLTVEEMDEAITREVIARHARGRY